MEHLLGTNFIKVFLTAAAAGAIKLFWVWEEGVDGAKWSNEWVGIMEEV